MQAFTSQPLTSQTSENPFTNPHLLATLMLPHLETYLSMHADIRFLILEYPPEHLSTIIAIQKLAGVDLVKIAQIVDAKSKERLPFRHLREGSISSVSGSSTRATSRYSRSSSLSRAQNRQSLYSTSQHHQDVNKTRANFLLTSSASDKDIANFVAAVWNLPVLERPQTAPEAAAGSRNESQLSVSPPKPSTKAPDSPPKKEKSVKRKAKPAPLRVSALSAFPKTTGPQSPLSPTANIMSVLPAPPALRAITAEDFYTVSASPSRSLLTPSPEETAAGQQGAVRMSAVGGGDLRRQASVSTMRTASTMDAAADNIMIGLSTPSTMATPHIAHMRLPPPTPSRLFGPTSAQQEQQQQHMSSNSSPPMLSLPRFIDTPSIAGSTLHGHMLDTDGASSIMTFDPADDSDYDQEERRLMPMFGRRQPRSSRTGTQKARKVLGMTA